MTTRQQIEENIKTEMPTADQQTAKVLGIIAASVAKHPEENDFVYCELIAGDLRRELGCSSFDAIQMVETLASKLEY